MLWGDPVWPRAEVVRADGAPLVEATTLDALDLRARIEALDLPDESASSRRAAAATSRSTVMVLGNLGALPKPPRAL